MEFSFDADRQNTLSESLLPPVAPLTGISSFPRPGDVSNTNYTVLPARRPGDPMRLVPVGRAIPIMRDITNTPGHTEDESFPNPADFETFNISNTSSVPNNSANYRVGGPRVDDEHLAVRQRLFGDIGGGGNRGARNPRPLPGLFGDVGGGGNRGARNPRPLPDLQEILGGGVNRRVRSPPTPEGFGALPVGGHRGFGQYNYNLPCGRPNLGHFDAVQRRLYNIPDPDNNLSPVARPNYAENHTVARRLFNDSNDRDISPIRAPPCPAENRTVARRLFNDSNDCDISPIRAPPCPGNGGVRPTARRLFDSSDECGGTSTPVRPGRPPAQRRLFDSSDEFCGTSTPRRVSDTEDMVCPSPTFNLPRLHMENYQHPSALSPPQIRRQIHYSQSSPDASFSGIMGMPGSPIEDNSPTRQRLQRVTEKIIRSTITDIYKS